MERNALDPGDAPSFTYGPFGERYEVQQYKPPLGGLDPVAMIGPGPGLWQLANMAVRTGGRLAGLELMARAYGTPPISQTAPPEIARFRRIWSNELGRANAAAGLGFQHGTPARRAIDRSDFPIIEGRNGEQY